MIKLSNLTSEILNQVYQSNTVYIYNNNTSTFITKEKDHSIGLLVASYNNQEWSVYDNFGESTKTNINKVKKLIGSRYIYLRATS